MLNFIDLLMFRLLHLLAFSGVILLGNLLSSCHDMDSIVYKNIYEIARVYVASISLERPLTCTQRVMPEQLIEVQHLLWLYRPIWNDSLNCNECIWKCSPLMSLCCCFPCFECPLQDAGLDRILWEIGSFQCSISLLSMRLMLFMGKVEANTSWHRHCSKSCHKVEYNIGLC